MGLFRRKDSPYWWMWLESTGAKLKVPGPILHTGQTPEQTKDQKTLALRLYHEALHDGIAEKAGVAKRTAPTTFRVVAEWYRTHKVPRRRGADRELEIVATLIDALGDEPIEALTKDRVSEWMTERLTQPREAKKRRKRGQSKTLPLPTAGTVNREVDVLKAILKAAVPR